MTNATENNTPPKITKSRNSNFSVQIQINPNFNLDLYREIPRNRSFWIWWISGAAIAVEIVIYTHTYIIQSKHHLCISASTYLFFTQNDVNGHFHSEFCHIHTHIKHSQQTPSFYQHLYICLFHSEFCQWAFSYDVIR